MTFNDLTDYNKKYLKYKDKYLKLKKLEQNITMKGGGTENKTLTLFKADWCGHCKSFKKTWNELKNNNDKINFVTYDSETNKSEIQKYGIQGFPTLILLVGDKSIEYVGPRNKEAIEEFINQY
jgi:thiol-disulfide isomerase/thioredoxin